MLNKLKNYDSINQYEAAIILSNSIDVKSALFKSALERIERAVDSGEINSEQAVEIALRRGNKDKANLLRLRKMFIPIQTGEDEKQTIIKMRDFKAWHSKQLSTQSTDNMTYDTTNVEPSVQKRLLIMSKAYDKFWKVVSNHSKDAPLNKIVAAWIRKEADVSQTAADNMASIIRPDWAKDRTWKNNQAA